MLAATPDSRRLRRLRVLPLRLRLRCVRRCASAAFAAAHPPTLLVKWNHPGERSQSSKFESWRECHFGSTRIHSSRCSGNDVGCNPSKVSSILARDSNRSPSGEAETRSRHRRRESRPSRAGDMNCSRGETEDHPRARTWSCKFESCREPQPRSTRSCGETDHRAGVRSRRSRFDSWQEPQRTRHPSGEDLAF